MWEDFTEVQLKRREGRKKVASELCYYKVNWCSCSEQNSDKAPAFAVPRHCYGDKGIYSSE